MMKLNQMKIRLITSEREKRRVMCISQKKNQEIYHCWVTESYRNYETRGEYQNRCKSSC